MMVGQIVVSKAHGMALYGRIEEGCCTGKNGLLCLTRLWKTPQERENYRCNRIEYWDTYDRTEDAPCWHRLESECSLYDFAHGPLYGADGKQFKEQP